MSVVILTIKISHFINHVNKMLGKVNEEDLKSVIDNTKRLTGNLARISDNLDEKEIANLIKSAVAKS
ncbi:hypothetical protein C2G38_2184256 [Gigaspora rosea]|uniref:Uncharacterized protein n=1 Tax=Gigaspora rosea TaxID=44941 RepID=A0A397VGX8_9GLOM|nr:hypothetical protein C2G38_2184256 [Gigaspora rosea]